MSKPGGTGPSFLCAVYETLAQAEEALDALRALADEGSVSISDAAIVVRGKGKNAGVELHQTKQLAPGEGIVAGGTVGIVLGVLIAGPVGGALVGMAGGGIFAAFDRGISDDRLRKLGEQLGEGQAALGALLEKADWPLLRARMAPYRGEVIVSELSAEALASLRAAASSAEP